MLYLRFNNITANVWCWLRLGVWNCDSS